MSVPETICGVFLNLGAGSHKLEGFTNVDLDDAADVSHDLTQGLPWADNSVDGIFSEHFIEHISQADGLYLLRECHRVLKPGARLRIATPDLDSMIEDYVENRTHPDWIRFGLDWVNNRCERLNVGMRWWGHQYVYNEEELVRVGRMAGFRFSGRHEYGKSEDPRFSNLEHRDASRLIVEFAKPERQLARDSAPLVSIAMPTYSPRFFAAALDSALAQTYRHIEVVITDDCPTNAIEKIAKERMAHDDRVRYYKNPERLVRANVIECFNQSRGEFVKFLNDDDLLAPDCVSRMLDAFRTAPGITLVTSHRQLIDETGRSLPDIVATTRISPQDILVDGLSLMQTLLDCRINFVGEPSTVMFRKQELEHLRPDFMSIDHFQVRNINDIVMWFHLAFRGDVVFLAESLSSFRRHKGQRQSDPTIPSAEWAAEGWKRLTFWWQRHELEKRRERGPLLWKAMTNLQADWQKHGLGATLVRMCRPAVRNAKVPTAPPSQEWNEQGYLAANPDVVTSVRNGEFTSGYHHYLVFGRNEKRRGGIPTPAPQTLEDAKGK